MSNKFNSRKGAVVRPLGAEPASAYIDVLAKRLADYEAEIEVLRWKCDGVYSEAKVHGWDKATVRKFAEKHK